METLISIAKSAEETFKKNIRNFENRNTIKIWKIYLILANLVTLAKIMLLFIADIIYFYCAVENTKVNNCFYVGPPRWPRGPRSSGRGFDSRYFHNFKCGLGMERGPPSLARITGYLFA